MTARWTSGATPSPGPPSCWTRRWTRRRSTRTPRTSTWRTPPRRGNCGPGSCRTSPRPCSRRSRATPPRTRDGFVSLDKGLGIIAAHAKSLGYDGLVLFLDELILWLASRIHDQRFVSREADKITNFVEGGDERRAIPVVSFIARQRDLRELVGEEMSGAAEAAVQDSSEAQRRAIRQGRPGGPQPPADRAGPPAQARHRRSRGEGGGGVRRGEEARPGRVGHPARPRQVHHRRGRGRLPADVPVPAGVHGHPGAHLRRAAAIPHRPEADGPAARRPPRRLAARAARAARRSLPGDRRRRRQGVQRGDQGRSSRPPTSCTGTSCARTC